MKEKSDYTVIVKTVCTMHLHPVRKQYTAPEIEIIDIETGQNILSGSGTTPDMPGEEW